MKKAYKLGIVNESIDLCIERMAGVPGFDEVAFRLRIERLKNSLVSFGEDLEVLCMLVTAQMCLISQSPTNELTEEVKDVLASEFDTYFSVPLAAASLFLQGKAFMGLSDRKLIFSNVDRIKQRIRSYFPRKG